MLGDRVPPRHKVIRLAQRDRGANGYATKDGGRFVAAVVGMRLTQADKTSRPPRLSVWDRTITSKVWLCSRLAKPEDTESFTAVVEQIEQIATLTVRYDSDVDERFAGFPETLGHAGIIGLDAGGERDYRDRRDQLIDCFDFDEPE